MTAAILAALLVLGLLAVPAARWRHLYTPRRMYRGRRRAGT